MDRWVKAGVIENRFEEDRISHALKELGIPFFIKSFLDTPYDGLYVFQKGWGVIFVPQSYLSDVEKIISEIKNIFSSNGE